MNFKSSLFRTSIVLVIVLFTIAFIHCIVPGLIVEIKHPLIGIFRSENPSANQLKNGKEFYFKGHEGIKLKAYLNLSSTQEEKGTIILLHGIRSNKESFTDLIPRLTREGFNIVALDSRAHGESEGVYCTFGYKEKLDVSNLLSYLEKESLSKNFGVWGQSLGGAIALQAMDTDSRIQFGVIESTFSDFRTITHDYFDYHLGFNISFLTNYFVSRAGEIADFKPDDACPGKFCQLIQQPVLLVHGTDDKRIDIKYAEENFELLKTKQKELLKIQGAGHLNVWEVGGEEYFNKAITFVNEQEVLN